MTQSADVTLAGVEALLAGNPRLEVLDRELNRAERAVERARGRGLPASEIEKLEQRLRSLQGVARSQVAAVHKQYKHMAYFLPNGAVSVATKQVIDALEKQDHWLAERHRANLIKIIEGNNRIPDAYRSQLPSDLATVLRICPNAAGLVTELSLRGQRGATGSPSKLGSKGNSGVGSAYEIMGTAALTRKVSTAGNTGIQLHINPLEHRVFFGDKMTPTRMPTSSGEWLFPTRRSVENDLRIITKTGYEIGVDFKHVKEGGTKGSSRDSLNQIENVTLALQQGLVDQYHFVTNGKFSESFKEAIATANAGLPKDVRPISYHEYVTSLVSDPASGGAAG